MRWGKVTIIGVGLLGGSVGLAVKQRKLAGEVQGLVRRKAAVKEATRLGVVHKAGMNLDEAVVGADLIILCTPIAQMVPLVQQMLPSIKRGAIVTDVGSVKGPVVRSLTPMIHRAGADFVGSHPMAGSEKGGMRESNARLFQDAVCVVTPTSKTSKTAVHKVKQFWQALGSQVLQMDPTLHDKLVSRASHLPHLLAAALVTQVLDPRQDKRQAELCATGFQDTTRIASSSPRMWRDIAISNRRNLVRDLAQFEKSLARLRTLLSDEDACGIETFLSQASERRGAWQRRKTSSSSE